MISSSHSILLLLFPLSASSPKGHLDSGSVAEIQGKQLLDRQGLREARGRQGQIDVVDLVHLFCSSQPAQQSHCKGVGNMMEIRGMGAPGEEKA